MVPDQDQPGIETALIDPGKLWQNDADESFNGKFRDGFLTLQWFRNRVDAKVWMAPPLQRGPPAFESRILDTAGIQNELCSQFHRGALTGDAGSR